MLLNPFNRKSSNSFVFAIIISSMSTVSTSSSNPSRNQLNINESPLGKGNMAPLSSVVNESPYGPGNVAPLSSVMHTLNSV